MSRDPLPGRPNLPEALALARELGCVVSERFGTGELKIRHAAWTKSLLINRRERTAPGMLITRLAQLLRARARAADAEAVPS